MKRILVGALVSLALGLVLASTVPASAAPVAPKAPAQQYPPCTNIEPIVLEGGTLPPGAAGELRMSGAMANLTYEGVLRSHTRTVIGPTQAGGDGSLTMRPAVPANFEVQALHQLNVFRDTCLAASFVFCVDSAGTVGVSIPACIGQVLPSVIERPTTPGNGGGGALAKTGSYIDDMLRLAALLIASGALVLYWRRRRQAAIAAV